MIVSSQKFIRGPSRVGALFLLAAILLFLALPIIAWYRATAAFGSPLAWAISCLAVGLAPFLFYRRNGSIDPFELIYPVIGYLSFLFGARAIYEVINHFPTMRFATPELVSDGAAIAITGMLGVYLGYVLPIGERLAGIVPVPAFLRAGESRYAKPSILIGVAIGLVGEALTIAFDQGASQGDVLQGAGTFWIMPLMNFLPFALYLGILGGLQEPRSTINWAFQIIVLGAIVACFPWYPSKLWLLQPFFYVCVIYHYRRRRFSLAQLLALALASFAIAQLLYIHTLGQQIHQSTLQSYFAANFIGVDMLWRLFFSRFYGFDSLCAIILHARQTGYYLGATYSDLATFFVPRAIWPGKPITYSYEFGFLLARYTGFGERAFAATTYFGELFLNFGVIGIAIGSLIFGFIMRATYEYLMVRVSTKSALLIYGVMLLHFLQTCEGALGGAIPLTLADLAPLAVLLWVSKCFELRGPPIPVVEAQYTGVA
jgi:hypothetical protein